MRPSEIIQCQNFPCPSARHEAYLVPEVEIDPGKIRLVLISECAPAERADDYYAGKAALFSQTTLQAFREAGAEVNSVRDLLELGIYMTTAVKCGKTGYAIETRTVENCSRLLERELALFPKVKAFLLMGDIAIKAFNCLAKRAGAGRAIPAGSTYKIRGGQFYYQDRRLFPSYLQAGPSFFIEKSKRRMIAEDLAAALELLK